MSIDAIINQTTLFFKMIEYFSMVFKSKSRQSVDFLTDFFQVCVLSWFSWLTFAVSNCIAGGKKTKVEIANEFGFSARRLSHWFNFICESYSWRCKVSDYTHKRGKSELITNSTEINDVIVTLVNLCPYLMVVFNMIVTPIFSPWLWFFGWYTQIQFINFCWKAA